MGSLGLDTNRFVGRRRELAELCDWLADARSGHGRLVVISGAAGVGKTRLAEELASRAGPVPVVWGRCSADAGAPPMWPLRRIIGRLPDGPRQLPVPDRARLGSSAEGSAAARFAQSVWVADTLVEAARETALLVIVEDAHWADSGTAAALELLAGEVTGSRVLVLATVRLPVEGGAAAALLDRGVEHRVLTGLDRIEIVEYLDALGPGRADRRYADLVQRQTAGNSLYVAAVARLLSERLSLQTFDAAAAQAALAGRPELADLARAPLSRLSADCRRLVEIASVLGEEISIVELTAARCLSASGLPSLVDDAVRAGVFTRPADAPGTIRFVHALVRDGVYGAMDEGERRRVHRAAAVVVAAADSAHGRIGRVANHLACGASTPAEHLQAATSARQAGHTALSALAYVEAAELFRSALFGLMMSGGPTAAERAENLLDLAFAEYRSGAFSAALTHCELAAELADSLQSWELLARAALLVDGITPPDADDLPIRLCRRALAVVPVGRDAVRAQLAARLAYAAADDGDLEQAARMSADALALAEQTGDPAALLAALRARHQALAGPGNGVERMQLGARAIEVAAQGEPMAALWGRLWRIDAAFELADLAAVDNELLQLAGTAAQLRMPLARWHLERARAAREALVGRFDVADEHARSARGLAGQLEDPSVIALYYAFQLFLGYTRGDVLPRFELDPGTQDFLRMAVETQLPIALTSAAIAMVSTGEMDEAARMARQLCSEAPRWPLDGRWIVTVPMLADVVADVDDAQCAAMLYPMLAPFGQLAIAGGSGAVACDGSVSRQLGRLAAACGQCDVAERHLREAIGIEEGMGGRPFASLSRMYLAGVLHRRGGAADLAVAAREARTALTAMRSLGMTGRAMQCARLLTEIDSALSRRTVLTPRERQIVSLISEGLSNRQIAERLFLSERTVESHVSHVLGKLAGTSRTDIVAWAFSIGAAAPPHS